MRFLLLLCSFCFSISAIGQFTKADSLRGSLNENRDWFDVQMYDLEVDFDLDNRRIKGINTMHFKALRAAQTMQIDLFENMNLDKAVYKGNAIDIEKQGNIRLLNFKDMVPMGDQVVELYFSGSPTVAENAPWDGGFVYKKDASNKHWVGLACEGVGASLWFPNKDHLSDEPEKVRFTGIVPDGLMFVSNGKMSQSTTLKNGKKSFTWEVENPINNYNISVNIADYAHFSETFTSPEVGDYEMDYYVTKQNLERAKVHFKQTKGVLEAFEYYLGPYPFPEDGFKLVETPFLGMEHQSCIAYGNLYMRGYLGTMIPDYMNWDYIIVHESGHEYFGNSISCKDHAEMWIHESFTTYLEALYVEYQFKTEKAVQDYLELQRPFVKNEKPILGPLGVNYDDWGSSDHYYKGSWMLHTLRRSLNDDKKWFACLRKMCDTFKHQLVDSKDVIDLINTETAFDWNSFFDQYLKKPQIPTLHLKQKNKRGKQQICYQWKDVVSDFDMPLYILVDGKKVWLRPTSKKQKMMVPAGEITLEPGSFLIHLDID